MATTALIVEILVVGVFGLIWVGLFVFKFFGLEVSTISNWLIQYKDWSTGAVLIFAAISYQLGWSINQFSYFVSRKKLNKSIRKKIFKENYDDYDLIKTTVFLKGTTPILDSIQERFSILRLTRSSSLNFLFISIGLFLLRQWGVGIVSLGISVVLLIQSNDIYAQYCSRILSTYKAINQENENKILTRKQKSKVKA